MTTDEVAFLIPPGHHLLPLLKQRDLQTALQQGLEQLIHVARAEGGTLYFAQAGRPVVIRAGHVPPRALVLAQQLEHSLSERLKQGTVSADSLQWNSLQDGRTILRVPLPGPESVLGISLLILPPEQQLHDGRLAEVRALADTVGTIGALLQTLARTQNQLDRLALLYDIGQALASKLDLVQLLGDTMHLAMEVMQGEASSLFLIDRETEELVLEIVHGDKRDQLQHIRMPLTQGIAGWVATTGESQIVNDPHSDPRFNREIDRQTGFRTRNILCVPMEIKGRIIGVLQVLNKPGDTGFDEEDTELLRTLAGQAAIAIENARLYRNLQEERDKIIQAQEDVRRELARNLHDGPVQQLTALSMNLEHTRRLLLAQHPVEQVSLEIESMNDLTQRAIRETRTLLFELRPIVLETQGLVAGLEAYAERLNQREGPGAKVVLEAPDNPIRLPPKVERTLFAIVQEAVGNARKHARADTIRVIVKETDDTLELVIKDDGKGFDLQQTQAGYAKSGSLGLINMRERAELIDADLRMETAPGEGVEVKVHLPLWRLQPSETL